MDADDEHQRTQLERELEATFLVAAATSNQIAYASDYQRSSALISGFN